MTGRATSNHVRNSALGMFKFRLLREDREYREAHWFAVHKELLVENYVLRRYIEALESRNPDALNSWLQEKCARQAVEIKRLTEALDG
jgi:hypothetical protein